MTVRLRLETEVAAPPAVVFDLSLSIDAHAASMRRWRGRAVGGRTTGRIGPGEHVTWRAWHAGVPWTLTSRITDYDRPAGFVDEQVRGPFAHYRHEHHFVVARGGTLMIDDITFAAPLGIAGVLAERCFLRRRVLALIENRNDHLRALAQPGRPPDLP
jgi:ligand-binding SRPBCC domain-containing protein